MNIPGKKKKQKEAEASAKENQAIPDTAENQTTEASNEEKQSKEESVDWKAKYDDSQDQYLRLYAEFENFRKRTARERQELILSAGSDVLKSILPVLDDLDRALENIQNSDATKAVVEGVELIANKLRHQLAEKGLKEMEVLGQTFDADMHEAITHLPAPSPEAKGTVLAVAEKGYTLHDKIIRYPKVVVAS